MAQQTHSLLQAWISQPAERDVGRAPDLGLRNVDDDARIRLGPFPSTQAGHPTDTFSLEAAAPMGDHSVVPSNLPQFIAPAPVLTDLIPVPAESQTHWQAFNITTYCRPQGNGVLGIDQPLCLSIHPGPVLHTMCLCLPAKLEHQILRGLEEHTTSSNYQMTFADRMTSQPEESNRRREVLSAAHLVTIRYNVAALSDHQKSLARCCGYVVIAPIHLLHGTEGIQLNFVVHCLPVPSVPHGPHGPHVAPGPMPTNVGRADTSSPPASRPGSPAAPRHPHVGAHAGPDRGAGGEQLSAQPPLVGMGPANPRRGLMWHLQQLQPVANVPVISHLDHASPHPNAPLHPRHPDAATNGGRRMGFADS